MMWKLKCFSTTALDFSGMLWFIFCKTSVNSLRLLDNQRKIISKWFHCFSLFSSISFFYFLLFSSSFFKGLKKKFKVRTFRRKKEIDIKKENIKMRNFRWSLRISTPLCNVTGQLNKYSNWISNIWKSKHTSWQERKIL